MTIFHIICTLPPENRDHILDRIYSKGFLSLKIICKSCNPQINFFEREEVVDYFLKVRIPKLILSVKPFTVDKRDRNWIVLFNQHNNVNEINLREIFKIIPLLPGLLPTLENLDKPSLLRDWLNQLSQVVHKTLLGDPLSKQIEKISMNSNPQIPLFMALVPTQFLPPTLRGFKELCRRYPKPSDDCKEFSDFMSIHILNAFNLSYGYLAAGFIQGASFNLLKYVLDKNPDEFSIGPNLIKAFKLIEDQIESHDKVLIFGEWLIKNSPNWTEFTHAHRLFCVLYMGAFVDQKSLMDRNLIKSWIPEKYLNWNVLVEMDIETGEPISNEMSQVVKLHFAEFWKYDF